jgi:CheY-like chemotaxis protein
MSHELRTPLNAILGYAQLIERGDTSPRFTSAARTIRESGAHLLTLINDILDLSKIEAGRVDLNPAPFDIHACLRGVDDMMRIRAAEKDLDFRCLVAADLPRFLVGDEARLRQVLINLLGNAVKFTRQGAVTLNVSLVAGDGPDPHVRFEVDDTGVGLAAEEMERIFTPFEQAGSVRGKASGTGLGLSISQQMIALMGSKIHVESEAGRGSRFWFTLVLPAGHVASGSTALPAKDVTSYAGNRRTILIVDDIEANRLLLGQDLEDLGFATFEAANGASAVEVAERIRPVLVLMDLKMAVMDGFEATRQLRAREGFADLPIIAVSASATDEVEKESREAGATAFLVKPIEREHLLEILGETLDLEWQVDAPVAAAPSATAGEFEAPPPERMQVLLHLARAGNISGIRHQAKEIIALDERYRPFAEELQELARNYHSPALLELIERHSKPREAA